MCVYVCMTDHLYWKMPWPQKGTVVSAIHYDSKDQTPLLRREESARYKQAVKWKTTSVFICFNQRWPHLVILTENYFQSLQRVKKVSPAICFLWECCSGWVLRCGQPHILTRSHPTCITSSFLKYCRHVLRGIYGFNRSHALFGKLETLFLRLQGLLWFLRSVIVFICWTELKPPD